MNEVLRIVPLGGLGEIGLNMMLVEYGDSAVAIDCGVMFPEPSMLGIDLVIPDLSYLRERPELLKAIVCTHGHNIGTVEQNVGGHEHGIAEKT